MKRRKKLKDRAIDNGLVLFGAYFDYAEDQGIQPNLGHAIAAGIAGYGVTMAEPEIRRFIRDLFR